MNAGTLRLESVELLVALAAFLTFAMISKRPRGEPPAGPVEATSVELEIFIPGGHHVAREPVPLTLGRTSQATVALPDGLVSRVHARIDVARGRAFIEDLQSRNGTFVNGKEVKRTRLQPGDEIVVGATRLIFKGAYPGGEAWT